MIDFWLRQSTKQKSHVISVLVHMIVLTWIGFLVWPQVKNDQYKPMVVRLSASHQHASLPQSTQKPQKDTPKKESQQKVMRQDNQLQSKPVVKRKTQSQKTKAEAKLQPKTVSQKSASSQTKKKLVQQRDNQTGKPLAKTPKKTFKKLSADDWKKAQQSSIQAEWQSLIEQRQLEANEKILAHVQAFWHVPATMDTLRSATLIIKTNPNGDVKSVAIHRSSGSKVLDAACKEAVWAASPLPLPDDATVANNFRDFDLVMRPDELLS